MNKNKEVDANRVIEKLLDKISQLEIDKIMLEVRLEDLHESLEKESD